MIRNNKINKMFCILVFLFICTSTIAQKDSIFKNHLSVNLASALISGEVGLYYDYRLSDRVAFQLSYGHRFYSPNIIQSGGHSSYQIFPQTGDIIRIGLKKYLRVKNDLMARSAYLTYRLSYWNLHTPKYTNRDGPNGYNMILREVVSVDKNVLNVAFGIGKEINFNKSLFLDLFYTIGASAGQKKTHKYSYGDSNAASYMYPTNTIVKSLALFPTIELGIKVGIGW